MNNKKNSFLVMLLLFIINGVLYFFNIGLIGILFFAVFGYFVHKYGINQKLRKIAYFLLIFGFLTNLLGPYYLSITANELIRPYINYSFPLSMLYPCGLFIFIKYDLVNIMKNKYLKKIVSFLDFYTFGIFLIHWYILKILINLFNINIHWIIFRLGAPVIVIMISIFLIYLIRKIPLIRGIVP